MNMQQIKWVGLFLLFCIPFGAGAQTRFQPVQTRDVDEARHKAVTNTLVPMAVGFAAAHFINKKYFQTVGSTLLVYGVIVGPSTGNIYAHDYLRAMLGIVARAGGGYLMKDATRELFGDDVAEGLGWDKKDVSLGDTRVLVGAGLIVGSAIYNIVSTKASVHRFNRKHGYYVRPSGGYRNGRFIPMISGRINF